MRVASRILKRAAAIVATAALSLTTMAFAVPAAPNDGDGGGSTGSVDQTPPPTSDPVPDPTPDPSPDPTADPTPPVSPPNPEGDESADDEPSADDASGADDLEQIPQPEEGAVAGDPPGPSARNADARVHWFDGDQVKREIFAGTNAHRVHHRLDPLRASAKLDRIAQDWATHVATAGFNGHNPHFFDQMNSGGYSFQAGAENMAYGQRGGYDAVNSWKNSDGHNRNMLGFYDRIGIGFSQSTTHPFTYVYVQVFGRANSFPAMDIDGLYGDRHVEFLEKNLRFTAWDAYNRMGGGDRYGTSLAVFMRKPQVGQPLFVVTGQDFPDALAAGAAAGKVGGDLILVKDANFSNGLRYYINKASPSKIWIIGGNGVVGDAVERELRTFGKPVQRVFGDNRYLTAERVRQTFFAGATEAFVATGRSFPDALAGSVLAGQRKAPIVLTPGADGERDRATVAGLKSAGISKVTILGGDGVVGTHVDRALQDARMDKDRIFGNDRYQTAQRIADRVVNQGNPKDLFMATGTNFADGLAGTALAVRSGAPLVLVRPTCVPREQANWIHHYDHGKRSVLGGSGAVSDLAFKHLAVC